MDKPTLIKYKDLSKFISARSCDVVDTFEGQLNELFNIRNPKIKNDSIKQAEFKKKYCNGKNEMECGVWIYYPWLNKIFHLLPEEEFFEVRTARNKPLINTAEQLSFYRSTVGIVGLSVGNSVALSIAYSGGCKHIKLADPDHFELSNLNRVRVSVNNLGESKAVVAAKQIYEINPYADIEIFKEGVKHDNLERFIRNPKIDFLIDEADDITLKFHLRLACRAEKIPLLMATDNGFNVDLDVLRFDLSSSAGGMKDAPNVELQDVIESLKFSEPLKLSTLQEVHLINELIGIKNVSYEMQKASILKIKGKIAGWPQLAMAAFVGGSAVSYALLRITSKKSIKRNKNTINLNSIFLPGQNSLTKSKNKQKHLEKFRNFIQSKN